MYQRARGPIFDSLCKVGYAGRFSPDSLGDRLQRFHLSVVALGGITPDRLPQLRRAGFALVPALGYVWLVEGREPPEAAPGTGDAGAAAPKAVPESADAAPAEPETAPAAPEADEEGPGTPASV